MENEFLHKYFEKMPTILFSAGQLERSGGGKKSLNILKNPCFQNFSLVFCVPIFIFFGPGSTAKLNFSPIMQHKQDMGHYSLTKREY